MWCKQLLRKILLLLSVAATQSKDPELPLCPTNMQYFPQNLPMHCRMPVTIPPFPPQIYQNPLMGKQSQPLAMPLPGIPGPMPGPIGGTMPMPMGPIAQAPAHKLPVIVMPFYSPDPMVKTSHVTHQHRPPRKHKIFVKKRRPKHYYNSDEDSTDYSSSPDDSSDFSSERGWWKGPREGRRSNQHHRSKRKKHQNKDILTPILQYVTKDGYVIFEKQIPKDEAKGWLISKSENKNSLEMTTSKNQGDPDFNDLKEDRGGTKFLLNNVEEIEIKTETNLPQLHKKRNVKRKLFKKPVVQ